MDEDPNEMLKRLAIAGMKERYEDDKKARERLEYELAVIKQMGYAGYFLIVCDLINYARKKGIPGSTLLI